MNSLQLRSNEQWKLVKFLGQGTFGEVHHWKNNETGQEIASKRLKANANLKPDQIDILRRRWLKEYNAMQNCITPHIVGAAAINDHKFLNYLAQQNHFDNTLPVIIMEYCNGGDLRSHLNKIEHLNGLSEYTVRNVLMALASAIRHLHEVCNIEHRDIKPENIVLHIQGNHRIYKLADFGYARDIPDGTVSQSVVGTSNYVAPEVIDPGNYTKTVDYYSIGVVTFEITCGVQPFIPHQSLAKRMKCILSKPPQCIDIVQNIDDLSNENFEFIKHIQSKNRSSPIFLNGIEKWLQLTLDKNYKTRGCDKNNVLRFYSDLQKILQKKIVTVFSLKTYRKYYYDIESFKNLQDFYQSIYFDNQIDEKNAFIFLPPLHPHQTVQKPEDFYVPEWCDTDNADNPPVMLFVSEFFIKPHCNIDEERHFTLSQMFKKCIATYSNDNNVIPLWLLEQFEREVHFIISNEQHLVECYLLGLKNLTMEIECVVFKYKTEIDMLNEKISELSGSAKHADVVSYELLNVRNGQSLTSSAQTTNNVRKIKNFNLAINNFKGIHNEILKKCKELATDKIYDEYIKKDVFELLKYRQLLSKKYTLGERLDNAQSSFEKCVQGFKMFISASELINIRIEIKNQIDGFNILRQNIYELNQKVTLFEKELYEHTRSLIRQSINITALPLNMSSLHIDGSMSASLVKDGALNILDNETPALINEFETMLDAMQSAMNID